MEIAENAGTAIRLLRSSGFEAYAVGGCVRDVLLGKIPKDWDIATLALPEDTLICFAGFPCIPTGLAHGTVTVLINGEPIEITTFRTDGPYGDMRHPLSVAFVPNLRDDLARRDFTINALALSADGSVIDEFGGIEDLKAGVLRTVGEPGKRFREDALRILRCLRFSATLGLSVDADTRSTAIELRELLHHISNERIRDELSKLLCGTECVRVLREFAPILATILPERFAADAVLRYEGALAVAAFTEPLLTQRLAALFSGIADTAEADGSICRSALSRLRYDHATVKLVTAVVTNRELRILPEKPYIKRCLNRLGCTVLRELMRLQGAEAGAACDSAALSELRTIDALTDEIHVKNECYELNTMKINGRDLMTLGFVGGPEMKLALQSLLDAVIDGFCENESDSLKAYGLRLLGKNA